MVAYKLWHAAARQNTKCTTVYKSRSVFLHAVFGIALETFGAQPCYTAPLLNFNYSTSHLISVNAAAKCPPPALTTTQIQSDTFVHTAHYASQLFSPLPPLIPHCLHIVTLTTIVCAFTPKRLNPKSATLMRGVSGWPSTGCNTPGAVTQGTTVIPCLLWDKSACRECVTAEDLCAHPCATHVTGCNIGGAGGSYHLIAKHHTPVSRSTMFQATMLNNNCINQALLTKLVLGKHC